MLRRLAKSPLIRAFMAGSLIFYILSGLTSLVNYLFYPVIARFVTVSEYGEVQFLVAMFAQLSVGFVVLNILAIIVSAKLKNNDQQLAISALSSITTAIAILIATIGSIALISMRSMFGLHNIAPIILLGVALVVNVPFTIVIGQLQGNGKFIASGAISLAAVAVKLIASLILAVLGFGVAGIIGGIAIGLVAAWSIGVVMNGGGLLPRRQPAKRTRLATLSFIKKHAFVTIVAVTVLTLLSSADSIVSRIVLSPHEAGQYASIATVTKIILAATTPIMWLALPVSLQNNNKQILRYTTIASILGGLAALMFIAAPKFFTTTLIGVDPASFISLIPIASLSMALFAVAFLVITANICKGNLKHVLVVSATAAVTYILAILILMQNESTLTASLIAQATAATLLVAGTLPAFLPKQK